jgi:hypothetical protein
MDLRTIGLFVCAVAAASIVARILWLFANRVPVLAHSENTDALGETVPGDPLNPPAKPHGLASLSPVHSTDMRVEYEVAGKQYEHDVLTHSVEDLDITAPDDMPILWADPANPAVVETRGPGFWALMLLLVGVVAAAFMQFSPSAAL